MPSRPCSSAAVALAALALLCGCSLVRVDLAKPITSFQESIGRAAAVLGEYYTQLNDYERELYLIELSYSGGRVALTANHQPTPLQRTYFTAEAIKARTDALAALGAYADALFELSGSDEPTKVKDQFTAVGETLTAVNSRLKEVESAKVDAAAGAYLGPLAALAGAIGEVALSRTRDAMLKTAIEQAAPKVEQILDLMHRDFAPVLISQRRLGEVEKLSDMVLAYNDGDPALIERIAKLQAALKGEGNAASQEKLQKEIDGLTEELHSPDERYQRLKAIGDQFKRYDFYVHSAPTNLIPAIRRAHRQLVAYAISDHTPEDLASLTKAVQSLKAETQGIVDALRVLYQTSKE